MSDLPPACMRRSSFGLASGQTDAPRFAELSSPGLRHVINSVTGSSALSPALFPSGGYPMQTLPEREPEINKLFRLAGKIQASNFYLDVGQPPAFRRRGV